MCMCVCVRSGVASNQIREISRIQKKTHTGNLRIEKKTNTGNLRISKVTTFYLSVLCCHRRTREL
jgi:hypothetical protein